MRCGVMGEKKATERRSDKGGWGVSDAFVVTEHAGRFDVIGPVATWTAGPPFVRTFVLSFKHHRHQAETAARLMNVVAQRAHENAIASSHKPGWAWIDAADDAARSVLEVAPFFDENGVRAMQLAAETGARAAVLGTSLDVLAVSAEPSISVAERRASTKTTTKTKGAA